MIEQPDATLCRCGCLLASCADCRAWLVEHSPRIERGWRFLLRIWGTPWMQLVGMGDADLVEENRLGVYLARRFLA